MDLIQNAASVNESGLSADQRCLLDDLVEQWQRHGRSDLDLRHRTGALLNSFLGSPELRQKRHAGVLGFAAERLGLAASVLNRLRWFAHHFRDVDDLHQRFPNVRYWSDVCRDVLPPLCPKGRRLSTSPRETSPDASTDDDVAVPQSAAATTDAAVVEQPPTRVGTDTVASRDFLQVLSELNSMLRTRLNPLSTEEIELVRSTIQELQEFADRQLS